MWNKMSVFVQVFQKKKLGTQRQICLIPSDERKAEAGSGLRPELSFSLPVRQWTAEPTSKVALPDGKFFQQRNQKIAIIGLFTFVFLLTFSAFPKEGDQESDDSSMSTAAQPQVQTTSRAPARFDPKKPLLTQKAIKKILEVDLPENLLEKKLPDQREKIKERTDIITDIELSELLTKYDRLMNNPELPEVTRIHPNWYKAYGEKLAKFKPVVSAVMRAVDSRSSNNYFLAVRDFKKLQEECLVFLKEPMPKITKEQYSTLHKANTKQRALDYEKYLKERRAAEIREAQEKKAKAAKKAAQ